MTGGNGEDGRRTAAGGGRTAAGGGLRVGRKEAQKAQNKTESQLSSGLGSSRVKLDQAAEALGATHFSRKMAQEAQESDGGRLLVISYWLWVIGY